MKFTSLRSMSIAGAAVALLAIGGFSGAAQAQDAAYSLTIRNHHFEPSTLNVKAGVKIKLTVTNAGTKPAEFESAELNREKVIAGGSSGVVFIGPLQPGSYPFFDDFDQANQGRVIAK